MGKNSLHSDAPVNEIVGLLYFADGDELLKLRSEYPSFSYLLKPGMTLGEGDDIVKDIPLSSEAISKPIGSRGLRDIQIEELKVRVNICKSGLNLILKRSKVILPKIKASLKLLNSIQFISQVISAVSGASLLLLFNPMYTKVISGSLVLAASLTSIYVQYKSGTIALGENSLLKLYTDLADGQITAEHFIDELSIIEQLNYSTSLDKASEIIQQSNNLSLKMKKIIQKY